MTGRFHRRVWHGRVWLLTLWMGAGKFRHAMIVRGMATGSESFAARRVAVLGAGTMGAQIAALLAERGIDCDLLDLNTRLVEDAKRRLLTMRPRVVDDAAALARIRAGSFDDDMHRLADADWIIEAVVERAQPKLELWARASAHASDDAMLSTNTSGIPIAQIAEALPPGMRGRFLGTHFFNPPRYLRLLELIPTDDTTDGTIAKIRGFAERALGKGVVLANDVPGFITNRIGCFYFLAAMRAADEFGLTPDEADALSGPLMGRSNSATYRTIDLVGVDILLDICDNTRAAIGSPTERQAFEPPEYLREMRRRGWLGGKAGQGFYKRERHDGVSRILALNPHDMRYGEREKARGILPSALGAIDDTGQRLRALVASQDLGGRFAWRALSHLLAFSAWKAGEVADDIVSIDRAMRWGFNWELGPFETWDALGLAATLQRMDSDGIALPEWVRRLAVNGARFYRREDGRTMQATLDGDYIPVCG